MAGLPPGAVTAIGETSLAELKTRPDYAITLNNTTAGFIEVKAPGSGADPRKFKGHDAEQWEKLQSLPNLLYTDGNQWSHWKNGVLQGEIVKADGDVRTSGSSLTFPNALVIVFDSFLKWTPTVPTDAKQLAEMTARLCKLVRSEVTDQLALKNPALTSLAAEWRKLLFPEATDEKFADGYAQAVTFGLLMARAKDIKLAKGLDAVAGELRKTNSLIGTALRLLTNDAEQQATLSTSLRTLVRVLDEVNWSKVSKGKPEAWLYFYEDFLQVYDNALRKQTGSYYTPPEVVSAMVRLVDEALTSRFGQPQGLASSAVTVADPAVGTGTFVLGVLRRIAETVGEDQGAGSPVGAIESAVSRLIAFEMQLGPFAVAELRVMAEFEALTGHPLRSPLRMYVTDTLGNPYVETEDLSTLTRPIAESRRDANQIKREEKITVVIGNPPYKEKAKGKGGWIEAGGSGRDAPLMDWMPPKDWKVGSHTKHLRNLYIYFWRWATWKVFDLPAEGGAGIVSFITVAGFLNGPGFQKMRDYLRRTAEEVWVIDCSPEGHQPGVPTRIFQGVQQPVCIVMVAHPKAGKKKTLARVRYTALPKGDREDKFAALKKLKLDGKAWEDCSTDGRAPFFPAATGEWATFPPLDAFFVDNGSGSMPGRTWVIAPDVASLESRWRRLVSSPPDEKEVLFHAHLSKKGLGDRHVAKVLKTGLASHPPSRIAVAAERGPCLPPVGYGYRSFDRQWIIPDMRLINRPNPEMWAAYSQRQVFLTALSQTAPRSGPGLTITALIPDIDHYKGSFGGRVYPLWQDASATHANIASGVLSLLSATYGYTVSADDVFAYIAAVVANPAYTGRFQDDLIQPGLRVPLTGDVRLFTEAVGLGREVVWLHTFGERCTDNKEGRPASPPRLPKEQAPRVPAGGGISGSANDMPDELNYDAATQTLHVGGGRIERVSPEVWAYEVSGKQVLTQWFSYRKKNRERPVIGDKRPPSKLGEIQPAGWVADYTTELLNVLNVLGRLVALEPRQADLLTRICDGKRIDAAVVAKAAKDKARDRVTAGAEDESLF